MARRRRSLAQCLGILGVLLSSLVGILFANTGMAFAASPKFLSYDSPTYGFHLQYPSNWHASTTPDHTAIFLSPGVHSACQVNVQAYARSGGAAAALAQVVPPGAESVTRSTIAGAPAVSFLLFPSAASDTGATTQTTVIAQPTANGGADVYTLGLSMYGVRLHGTNATCQASFAGMVSSLTLRNGGFSPPAAVLTNPGLASIQYANNTWNWTYYTGSCCAAQGDMQPSFQCAEYVARALAAQGLLPGLTTSSSQSAYGNYSHNGITYDLLDVGVPGVVGLYDYLINNGLGWDVGDNPEDAVPGDVVFYYNGWVNDSNRAHVTLLTQTGVTPGGTDTLMDTHNYAAENMNYTNVGQWVNGQFQVYQRSIVHLNINGSGISCKNSQSTTNCDGKDPDQTGCSSGAYVLGGDPSNIQVLWGPNCNTNYAYVAAPSGYYVSQVFLKRSDGKTLFYCQRNAGSCNSSNGNWGNFHGFVGSTGNKWNSFQTDILYAPVDSAQVCMTFVNYSNGSQQNPCSIWH